MNYHEILQFLPILAVTLALGLFWLGLKIKRTLKVRRNSKSLYRFCKLDSDSFSTFDALRTDGATVLAKSAREAVRITVLARAESEQWDTKGEIVSGKEIVLPEDKDEPFSIQWSYIPSHHKFDSDSVLRVGAELPLQ